MTVDMAENSDDEFDDLPSEVLKFAKAPTPDLLSPTSKKLYEKAYNKFLKWCKLKNIKKVTEKVLLIYFCENLKNYKASSLWSYYFMIKPLLKMRQGIDIGKFSEVIAFLKRKSNGDGPNKLKVLNTDQISKFIAEAPDDAYLMIKVALILWIAGSCRREELSQLMVDDIEDVGSALIVHIKTAKRKMERIFTVADNKEESFLELFRKYARLRPAHTNHRRFFLFYKNGKCSTQVVGKNTFGSMSKRIAAFLKLPEPSSYTSHCFRRSSTTLVGNL